MQVYVQRTIGNLARFLKRTSSRHFARSLGYLEGTDVMQLRSCLYLCVTFPWGENHSFTFKYANHCARYASVNRGISSGRLANEIC